MASQPAFAQSREITPLVGWQGGGSVSVNRLNTGIDQLGQLRGDGFGSTFTQFSLTTGVAFRF